MLNSLRNLFKPPHFDDDDQNRIAVFLHIVILSISTIAFLVGLVDALNGVYVTGVAMLALISPMIIAFWVNQRGNTTMASYIVIHGAVVAVTITLAVGQGIHDIGIVDYGLILIVASYLLKRAGIISITIAIVVSVAIVVFGEMAGLLPVQVTAEKFMPRPADFMIVSLSLIVGAVAIFLLSTTLEKALEKARNSELRWRSLIDNIPDIVVMLDHNGVILSINHTAAQETNFYLGKTVFQVLVPDETSISSADFAAVLQGQALTREVKLQTSNGTIRWFSVGMGPLCNPNGSIDGAIAVVRDIQEQKDAEKALHQSRETLRAQTQRLQTLQEINRAISGLQDLQGTLHLILEQVKAVMPTDAFVVALYDQETNMISFPLVYDEGQIYEDAPRPLFPESLIAEAIHTRKTCILDRTEDERLNDPIPPSRRLGSKKASAAVLTAPMIIHDRVIGAVAVHSYQPRVYTQDYVAVLSGAANQIAIAIENARLYETSQKRADQLATLNEIGRSISSLQDLNGVLNNTHQLLKQILELDAFYIALYYPENDTVSFPIIVDQGERWHEAPSPLEPGSQMAKTIQTGQPYLVNRSHSEIERRLAEQESRLRLGNKTTISASLMIAPLRYGGKILGVISAQSYKLDAYNNEDLELLLGIGNQVAIAIENARLYTELQKELAERKRAEAEVRHLNADLEARVRQRTAELEAANQELASFTYTVSHDLRAPIRGIHGLSYIIIDEYAKKIPVGALENVRRIQANARQMGLLIDELLAFTHLGRQAVRKTTLNMTELVKAVIDELVDLEKREIEFVVGDLPTVYADPQLLRQALDNLIGNAIKFTSKINTPRIEFDSFEQGGEVVYFIRDNGAGFEMTYAKKLFGVFERLHRQDEFEGIGVGLAIVKRILEKHGGRIWAEGQVNQGATFYFTLPAKKEKRK